MLTANQIVKLVPEGGSITFSFTVTKEGKLAVLFKPQYPENKNLSHDVKEAVEKVTAPRLITGTPDELDNSFMELIGKAVESVKTVNAIIEEVDKDAKDAIEKIKTEGVKKVETAIREAKKKEKEKIVKGKAATTENTTSTDSLTPTESTETKPTESEPSAAETADKVNASSQSSQAVLF